MEGLNSLALDCTQDDNAMSAQEKDVALTTCVPAGRE